MFHLEIGKVLKLVLDLMAYHQHLNHICQEKGLDNIVFTYDKCLLRIIVNSRGCFTTDLKSKNCITEVATNS